MTDSDGVVVVFFSIKLFCVIIGVGILKWRLNVANYNTSSKKKVAVIDHKQEDIY